MISLSAPEYDPSGHVVLAARLNNPYQGSRRGSVTATLDGESAVYDTGYSVSDQTVTARLRKPSRALAQQLRYLVAYYPELILCAETGVYRARPSFSMGSGDINLQLRLLSRLDQ